MSLLTVHTCLFGSFVVFKDNVVYDIRKLKITGLSLTLPNTIVIADINQVKGTGS